MNGAINASTIAPIICNIDPITPVNTCDCFSSEPTPKLIPKNALFLLRVLKKPPLGLAISFLIPIKVLPRNPEAPNVAMFPPIAPALNAVLPGLAAATEAALLILPSLPAPLSMVIGYIPP